MFTSLDASLENYTEPHRNISVATDDQLVDEDFVSFRALEEQIPSFLIHIKVFFHYLYNNFYKCATLISCTHLEFPSRFKNREVKV